MTTRPTVLLVDDNTDEIDLMCLALARSDAPVRFVCVTRGQEAIKYLSGHGRYADHEQFPAPVLVLLDLAMPDMNGFDILRWMQQHPGTPPVLVLTSSRMETDARLARELGAAAFITKPVDLDGTITLLKSLKDFWTSPLLKQEAAGPAVHDEAAQVQDHEAPNAPLTPAEVAQRLRT